jgi:hypothetical protein
MVCVNQDLFGEAHLLVRDVLLIMGSLGIELGKLANLSVLHLFLVAFLNKSAGDLLLDIILFKVFNVGLNEL